MPADQEVTIAIGRDGLNLRDQPAEVPVSQLTDSLNWRIDENGSLVKRLGYVTYEDSGQLAAQPLEVGLFNPSTGTKALLFYCSDGKVYSSPGDGTFTQIATGLSTAARPSFAMLADKVYWSNGTDAIKQWDGTTLTSIADADAPKAKYLAVWRNRLWAAGDPTKPHRVYWSDIGNPASWNPLNFVDIFSPRGDEITGLASAPNIGASFEGSDGVLVYMHGSCHRVFDDTDNAVGADGIGGANVLIDASTGTEAHRSLIHLNGRVYSIAKNGIYSTDGHGTLRLETGRLGAFFADGVNPAFLSRAVGVAWKGSYWAVFAAAGSGQNNTVLEVYTDYPAGPDGQRPVMALTLPIAAAAVYPAATGDQLIFCDATVGQERWVRHYGVGGADTIDTATSKLVAASARSGNSPFGTPHPKRVRRLQALGRGTLLIGVTSDLERGVGETRLFQMPTSSGAKWNQVKWNQFKWGPLGGVNTEAQWYTKRGRLFGFAISESSAVASSTNRHLGAAAQATGGAALYVLTVRTTPLDSE